MQKKIITEEQQKAARYAKAMGHPIRMYVLDLLSKQSCCYSGDLTEELSTIPYRKVIYEIPEFFDDEFFETKKVVYLQR